MTSHRVHRRAFLGGAAVTVGLPFLESLGHTARADIARKRLLCIHLPNGVWRPTWFPTTTGPSYTLSPTLAPLAKVRSKLLVFSGLDNHEVGDSAGAHNYGPAGMLTCRLASKGEPRCGVSMDQVVAQTLAGKTRIQSMQLGLTDSSAPDAGYPAIYRKSISWTTATQPLPPTIKPDVVFDQIFAGQDKGQSANERTKQRALRKSVLDYTLEQASTLSMKLAAPDRVRLEEYTTGVRELERQIDAVAAPIASSCAASGERPASNPALPERVRIMSDLMVLAFRCDTTRVISFMHGNGGENWSFPFLGIPDGHHGLSHHQMRASNAEKLMKIDLWTIERLAFLLEKMDTVDEGGSTMLDSSVVLVSNEISDGDRHDQSSKPILVAGRAGGLLPGGGHSRHQNVNQANLFITLMNLFGANVTSFGLRGTRPLSI